MRMMTGGEVVHQTLVRAGVEHVFGIVSVHNIPIYDAIDRGGRITPVTVRHEQAAVHAADGYARTTGRLGVAITSTGPGAANGVAGLYEAAFASSPVLMITGQANTRYLGKGRGFVHEAENQAAMLATVTRRVESVRVRHGIAAALTAVMEDIQTGRPQPGCVEIPIDLQYAPAADGPPPPGPAVVTLEPDAAAIAEAAALLAGAERPLILSGGGVLRSGGAGRAGGAAPELQALAERLQAPVLVSVNGRGGLPAEHPLYAGVAGYQPELRALCTEADVVLAVGTRMSVGHEARNLTPLRGKLIHVDADPGSIARVHPTTLGIVADAAPALAALAAACAASGPRAQWIAQAAAAREAVRQRLYDMIGPDHTAIMHALRNQAPPDAVFVRDSTVPAYLWGHQLLPILQPRTTMHPTAGAIGPGLPLALGAATAGRRTVLISGDGGFMLHPGELATAAEFRLPIVICLFNDGGYGVLRRIQAQQYGGRTFAVDLKTPDFAALARSMGVAGQAVRSAAEFAAAFAAALETDGPVLLEIDMNALHPLGDYPPRARPR